MTKRILKGTVIKDKSDKTVVVEVIRKVQHKLYKKIIKRAKKYHAHDENNKYKNGDKVLIIESKPFSKNKKFQVMENSKWSKYKLNY